MVNGALSAAHALRLTFNGGLRSLLMAGFMSSESESDSKLMLPPPPAVSGGAPRLRHSELDE
jgi:hypothetical protein